MKNMLTTLDGALDFVDSTISHSAPRYARSCPEAIPDLIQEARVAVWLKWQQAPGELPVGLCVHVAKCAFYHFCVTGKSVDSHILPARAHERPHGEYSIVSLEQAFAGEDDEAEAAGNEPEWKFDAGREGTYNGSPPDPRHWELRALNNVLLEELDQALDWDPSTRYTLRMLLDGYSALEIAHERNISRWRVWKETKRIIATGRHIWGIETSD